MDLSNNLIATIRTLVPLAAGWVVAQLALLGIALPADTELQLATALTSVAAALYWAGANWASKRWTWARWLLGNPRQPKYPEPRFELGDEDW